jgi:hypothetical protein
MRRGAAAAANPSTSEPLAPLDLIQIEEPGTNRDTIEDKGLAIGIEPTKTGIRAAISVGGNLEVLRSSDGGLELVPLSHDMKADMRNLLRDIAMRTGRLVTGVALVFWPSDDLAWKGEKFLAVEGNGAEVLAMVEGQLAISLAGGLEARGPGHWLFVEHTGHYFQLTRLETEDRLYFDCHAVADPDDVIGTANRMGKVDGVIAPGVAEGPVIAAALGVPLLEGFDDPSLAVRGAAILAEALA